MVYMCKEHGEKNTEWCVDCQEIVQCDHKDIEYYHTTDIIFDTKNGECTTKIGFKHCGTCGKILEKPFYV